jgi:hypothetical protein
MFIGLNPSTADETKDDPTIKRCIAFAKAWGYGSLIMANLFAWRATDPDEMQLAADPVGPQNDWYLAHLSSKANLIVAAWGTRGAFMGRDQQVRGAVPGLHHLRLTKEGHPGHPLYLRSNLRPVRW